MKTEKNPFSAVSPEELAQVTGGAKKRRSTSLLSIANTAARRSIWARSILLSVRKKSTTQSSIPASADAAAGCLFFRYFPGYSFFRSLPNRILTTSAAMKKPAQAAVAAYIRPAFPVPL